MAREGRSHATDWIPYARQWISEEDAEAAAVVLRSDWITSGPQVEAFERAVAQYVQAPHGVAVSSGTAALHASMFAAGIGPGDEVVVPAMTFAATANAVVYQGATPVFADVEPDTLLVSPSAVEEMISPRTRAVVAVDYGGQPCDYDALRSITEDRGLALIGDSSHALGALYRDKPIGTLADLTTFSFHPVKHITTGEGGMVVTGDRELAASMRRFRNHGISTEARQRRAQGTWLYEMTDLGYNYRLTDFQCALGIKQLERLPGWIRRRREIARRYDEELEAIPGVSALVVRPEVHHVYHLYVIQLGRGRLSASREGIFTALRDAGIGVNVHYIPVHLHPYYRRELGTGPGLCPVAEKAYESLLSLPLFAAMDEQEVERVVQALRKVIRSHAA